MVTGARLSHLFVITDDKDKKGEPFPYKTASVVIEPDLQYIEEKLFPELMKFWKMVQDKVAPKMTDMDTLDLSKNEALAALLDVYKAKKEIVENAEKQLKETYDQIFKIAHHTRNVCNGIKITKTKSADSVKPDYEKYCKEHVVTNLVSLGYGKTVKGRVTKKITFPKN